MTANQVRPNIVLILADDLGFSDLQCYGGEIPTPNLNRLASEGARLTQFYNTARCTPSRASLLTGLHPHQVGTGILTGSDGELGYPGTLNRDGATLAEILKSAGYSTALTGKWHLSSSLTEPDDAWPTHRGFDYFWGTIAGAGSFYQPGTLTRGEESVDHEAAAPDFYYTTAIGDEAVERINHATKQPSPFFLYVPFTAPHWPLHAPEAAVEKHAGAYDSGWDELRRQRLNRQIELGLFESSTGLTERDAEEPAWHEVPDDLKEWYSRRMEVYAAQVSIMDDQVGRILDAIDANGITGETIVIFLSDNGACAEEIPNVSDFETRGALFSPLTKNGEEVRLGSTPDIIPGPATTYSSYGRAWANLSNTPFRLYKRWVHEGGIAAPFIIRANGIAPGSLCRSPQQLTDILPTLLEATAVSHPTEAGDNSVLPPEGRSFLGELKGDLDSKEKTLYWEHTGNCAIRRGDMKLVRRWPEPWELYDLSVDPTESVDILPEHRDLAETLLVDWARWADRVGVKSFDRIVDMYRMRGYAAEDAAQ